MQDFWDEENGGFYFCSKSSKELIANPKPVYDGAMPSANSVSALNLLRLAVLTGKISSVNMPTGYFPPFLPMLQTARARTVFNVCVNI